MKNRNLIESVKIAIIGMITAFKIEKNFRTYTIIAMVGLILNILFKIEFIWWISYMLTVLGVFSAEYMNTAIENLADTVTTEIQSEIKIVKDIAASSVLTWGIGYFAVEVIAIGSKIIW